MIVLFCILLTGGSDLQTVGQTWVTARRLLHGACRGKDFITDRSRRALHGTDYRLTYQLKIVYLCRSSHPRNLRRRGADYKLYCFRPKIFDPLVEGQNTAGMCVSTSVRARKLNMQSAYF